MRGASGGAPPPVFGLTFFLKSLDFFFMDSLSRVESIVKPPRIRHGGQCVKLLPPYYGVSHVGKMPFEMGAIRGVISSFSFQSRDRFEQKLEGYSSSSRGVKWVSFITLTYHAMKSDLRPSRFEKKLRKSIYINYPERFLYTDKWGEFDVTHCARSPFVGFGMDLQETYKQLKAFCRSLSSMLVNRYGSNKFRSCPPLIAWKREFTSAGVVHYHLLVNGDCRGLINSLERRWALITGNFSGNSVDVKLIKDKTKSCWYMAKYIEKYDSGGENKFCSSVPSSFLCGGSRFGRCWGFFNERYYRSTFVPVRYYNITFPVFRNLFFKINKKFDPDFVKNNITYKDVFGKKERCYGGKFFTTSFYKGQFGGKLWEWTIQEVSRDRKRRGLGLSCSGFARMSLEFMTNHEHPFETYFESTGVNFNWHNEKIYNDSAWRDSVGLLS